MLGDREVVIAGGMENMSMTPFYLDKARYGYKLGNSSLIDGLIRDGLTDVYNQQHMGIAAELCAREYKIGREEQDAYAVESYKRSAKAWSEGKFNAEVVPVTYKNKKGEDVTVAEDEEYKNVRFDKIPGLKPVFDKEGTVTAANASTLNDGASALLIMSEEKAKALGLKPLARIVSYADAEQSPEWFTTSPAKAAPIALEKAGLKISQMDAIEINEAFSVVSLANIRLMEADAAKVNINGGAVSLGHPLGSSGSRILVTLLHVLQQKEGRYGLAAICNGGGGASAVVIEKL
jgi:acetyl-CoA C-acetyltransferase